MAGMLDKHNGTKTDWHRREGAQRQYTLEEGRQLDARKTHQGGAGNHTGGRHMWAEVKYLK